MEYTLHPIVKNKYYTSQQRQWKTQVTTSDKNYDKEYNKSNKRRYKNYDNIKIRKHRLPYLIRRYKTNLTIVNNTRLTNIIIPTTVNSKKIVNITHCK